MKAEFEKYLNEEFCGLLNEATCRHFAEKAAEIYAAEKQELCAMLQEFVTTDEEACKELRSAGIEPPAESFLLQNKAKKLLLKAVDTNKD